MTRRFDAASSGESLSSSAIRHSAVPRDDLTFGPLFEGHRSVIDQVAYMFFGSDRLVTSRKFCSDKMDVECESASIWAELRSRQSPSTKTELRYYGVACQRRLETMSAP